MLTLTFLLITHLFLIPIHQTLYLDHAVHSHFVRFCPLSISKHCIQCFDLCFVFDSNYFCVVAIAVVARLCWSENFASSDCYNEQLPLPHRDTSICVSDVTFLNESTLKMALLGERWEPTCISKEP